MLLGIANQAAAQSALCDGLRAELAAMTDTIGSNQSARKYARAIANQNFEIRKVKGEQRRLRCGQGSIIIVGGEEQKSCKDFAQAINRMQANLDILTAKRSDLLQTQTNTVKRVQLQDRIDQSGCNDNSAEVLDVSLSPEQTSPAIDPNALPNETLRRPDSDYGNNVQMVDLGGTGTGGGLKTLCVRTCDGGFFPISNHATSSHFQRDAQVCSMMCPGTETELFYQSLTADDTENMMSTATGQRYGDLKHAFLYRTKARSSDKACGCNLQAYYREMLKRENALATPSKPAQSEAVTWVKPEMRTTLGGDKAAPIQTPIASERPFKPDPKIRKIGPDFLPAIDDRINLLSPEKG